MSSDPRAVARALAGAFLDTDWGDAGSLADRGAESVTVTPRRLIRLARVVLAAYRTPPLDRPRELAGFIAATEDFERLLSRAPRPQVWRHFLPVQQMTPARWPVPRLNGVGDLAAWAGVTVDELEWLADVRSLERLSPPRLRHYRRTWVYNRRGRPRLLEVPKPRLMALQRRVLHEILGLVPTHPAAHGFVAGRSVRTFALPHVGRDVVVHLDLDAFFPSVTAGRVFGVLRSAGYPEVVAHSLTGLATTVLPRSDRRDAPQALRDADLERRRRLLTRLAAPHLPQGAPTSPALANLTAYRLDVRLAGIASAMDAGYTRYADDLAFSLHGADAARRGRRLVDVVGQVVRAEGFRVNEAKTTITSRSQQQRLCGLVVNDHPAVKRRERDELRAIVHNCHRLGPASQNHAGHPDFRAHLTGRIAWVAAVNPAHGARLSAALAQIEW